MRKFLLILAAALFALPLSGCNRLVPEEVNPAQTVYASFPPVYALSQPILSGAPGITLKCLVQPQDGCPRSYALSDWDEALLSGADAVILFGRGFESFETQLSQGNIAAVGAMNGLTLINNGSLAPEGDEADHFDDENPWAYLSVERAREICGVITAGMIALDPAYEELYEEKFDHFDADLEALQTRMEEAILAAPALNVAVAHEGLFYLADDLGLSVAAVVRREPGSELTGSEREASIQALRDGDAKVVLIERHAPRSLRDALEAAGFQLALIDTLATRAVPSGADYTKAMEQNARSIADALVRAAA